MKVNDLISPIITRHKKREGLESISQREANLVVAAIEVFDEELKKEENKPDVALLRDAWSVCWAASARVGYSMDKIQKSFEEWMDERKIKWRDLPEEKEKEDEPVLVGHLTREYSYGHYLPAKKGTEVYEHKGKYFFTITPADDKVETTQQMFYKEDLEKHINFI